MSRANSNVARPERLPGRNRPTRPSRAGLLAVAAVLCGASAVAQSFDDLAIVRDRPYPFSSLLQIKAGAIGSMADSTDPAAGLDDELGWDGHVYFRDDNLGPNSMLEAYAGRDGALVSLRDGQIVGGGNVSRLELRARYFPFYREGFYRGNSFVPVGSYEGSDYEAYLGFARPASEDMLFEFGPFYRRNSFSRNRDTAPTYIVPDDFDAYGLRAFAEHKTLQMDRRRGVPRDGFLATALVEREWNDSVGAFGVSGGFESELGSSFWRGRGHLEWFIPGSEDATWVVWADGAWKDKSDRIDNYDAQRPQGSVWADGKLMLRWYWGDAFVLTPFAHLQFTRILEENGVSHDKEFFFGGGVEADLLLGDTVSLNAWYSYLDNESRPSVSITDDVHGEHMFFVGVVVRLGGARN